MPREYRRVTHDGGGKVITKQADAQSANINTIMDKWIAHGTARINAKQATYGDFTNATDYHSAMNLMRAADQDFTDLPAAVRKHVHQDPGEFLDMVYDPERRGELEDLGLLPKAAPLAAPAAAEPPKPPVEDPPPTE